MLKRGEKGRGGGGGGGRLNQINFRFLGLFVFFSLFFLVDVI